jgi:hypothetical protein
MHPLNISDVINTAMPTVICNQGKIQIYNSTSLDNLGLFDHEYGTKLLLTSISMQYATYVTIGFLENSQRITI